MESRVLTRRNAATLRNKSVENQENGSVVGAENQRLLRAKQNVTGGNSFLPRPAVRKALGDINRGQEQQLPKKDGKQPQTGTLKSNGYGAQVQSRLVKKPEPRRPLHSVSTKNTTLPSTNSSVAQLPAAKAAPAKRPALLSSNRLSVTSLTDNVPKVVISKVVTRAAAQKSITPPPVEDVEEEIKDASMRSAEKIEPETREPTPECVIPSELEVDPGSTISSDISDLKDPKAYSTAMIPNIDEGDEDNPQLVTEYVSNIYNYLRYLETVQTIKEDFLCGKAVTPRMRAILIDWLVQVHVRFHLLPETLYMTVAIIDRYVAKSDKVNKDNLQLIGVTAMFVASKYEEMYAPEVGDFVYITDNSFPAKQILRMEIEILRVLDFDLGRPLPIHFLRRFSKAAEADVILHSMAKYFMELALVEYGMAHLKPSKLAAAALWIAQNLLQEGKWSATLNHYTRYSEDDLKRCVQLICKTVLKVHTGKSKLQAVRNKHGTSKFQEISKHSALDLDGLRNIVGAQ